MEKISQEKRFKTVDEYIISCPENFRSQLRKLRKTIRKVAPEASEIISYNMPALKLHGRILVYYAAHKEHIGLYPYPSAINAFKKESAGYETSKGTIRFPIDKPIPLGLVEKLVKYRIKEMTK